MTRLDDLRPLRRGLLIDLVLSSVVGVGMVIGAQPLSELLLLPEPLLRIAGVMFAPFIALLSFLLTRSQPPYALVWTVIVLNVIWAVSCVALLLSGWVAPNALGYGFILFQAGAVLLFAELQYLGLRRLVLQPAV